MEIDLPSGWCQIKYYQWKELIELEESDLSFYSMHIERFAILTDTTSSDECWEEMDTRDIKNIVSDLKWLKTSPTNNFKRKIYDFEIKDINLITLGEFIDLEYYFSENYYENLLNICAVLYRKTKIDEWGNKSFEPYGVINIQERSKLFEEIYIEDIYGIIKYFIDFKETFNETYENLFEPTFEDIELDDDVEEEYDEEEQKEIEEEKKLNKWGWENILHNLSGGDITKYDEITNLPLIFVFNQLSYRKDLNI